MFKTNRNVGGYENPEAFFKDHDVSFTDNEEGSDADDPDDKDWIQTPLYRRIKQVREQNKGLNTKALGGIYARESKRKSSQDEDSDDFQSQRPSSSSSKQRSAPLPSRQLMQQQQVPNEPT